MEPRIQILLSETDHPKDGIQNDGHKTQYR